MDVPRKGEDGRNRALGEAGGRQISRVFSVSQQGGTEMEKVKAIGIDGDGSETAGGIKRRFWRLHKANHHQLVETKNEVGGERLAAKGRAVVYARGWKKGWTDLSTSGRGFCGGFRGFRGSFSGTNYKRANAPGMGLSYN